MKKQKLQTFPLIFLIKKLKAINLIDHKILFDKTNIEIINNKHKFTQLF